MYFQLMLPGVRDGEELVLMVDGQRHKVMKHPKPWKRPGRKTLHWRSWRRTGSRM